jgi:hypothetical protein
MNGVSNQFLKNLVGADQRDWADYVGKAEFNCYITIHLATKGPLFVVAYGMMPNCRTTFNKECSEYHGHKNAP